MIHLRLAMLSPLPPVRSGIAHYVSMLLPALRGKAEVTASDGPIAAGHYDAVIYQLGNNPHHEFIYAEAMRNPGVAVLHDVVLHHLIVEMTLARGDADGYVKALGSNHGDAGAAWARGRAAGLHSEMGNFLFPASMDVARRSRAVIVHNRWAADQLRSWGVQTPIHVVPHPFADGQRSHDAAGLRRRLGIEPDARVIGFFGFLTSAKRAEVVLEAFRLARKRNPRLRLLVVGEPAPNIDMTAIAGEGVIVTGYVPDEEFDAYYAAADRLVNLRYPSAGETSGTLIRAFAAGKPVAVSDYAQFAEYPNDCVVKIAFGADEAESLADFFVRNLDEPAIARAQRAWLQANARIGQTVQGYLDAVSEAAPAAPAAKAMDVGGSVPLALFPRIELVKAAGEGERLNITLRNTGPAALRARVYGQPGYRLIARFLEGGREVESRWIDLEGDVRPGEATQITLIPPAKADHLELHHALQSIPIVDSPAAVSVELRRVQ